MHRWLAAAFIFGFMPYGSAFAQGLASCNDALVRATYNRFDSQQVDWRLAKFVNEETYNNIKHDAGANAVIYGFPAGASYGDFSNTVDIKFNSVQESLSLSQALNVMWTGLDPNSPSAYSDCLRAQVLNGFSLHVAVKFATDSDIALTIKWGTSRTL